MNKFLLIFLSIILIINFVTLFSINSASAFDFKSDSGLEKTAEETGHTIITSLDNGNWFAKSIGKFIKAFLSFLGVIFLLIMIYGGYIWMMAAGNEQQVEKAKSTIKNAFIGLVIVLAAYAITAFIGSTIPPTAEECSLREGCRMVGTFCECNLPPE